MRLCLSWLILGILTIVFIVLAVQGKDVYDAFTDKPREGFVGGQTDDISLTSCPAKTVSYVDNEGNTVCCDGSVENGKCIGRIACSVTKTQGGYPTCGRYWAAILEERGRDRCPTSMPNYYENMTTGVKGCARGSRNQDGSAPLPGVKFCRLYTEKKDEEAKEDSCTNQELLEKTICFPGSSVNVTKKIEVIDSRVPAVIKCNFGLDSCYTEDSVDRYQQFIGIRNWKDTFINMDPIRKLNFCPVAKRYKIDKTLQYDDLKYATLTGVNRPAVQQMAPPPPAPPPRAPVLKKIGGEGQTLYVPPNTIVQYGARGKYVTKKVSGWFKATNQFFGRDPIPGVYKEVLQET
jgi:hypothetical protein